MLNKDESQRALEYHYRRIGEKVIVGNPLPFVESFQIGGQNQPNIFNDLMSPNGRDLVNMFYGDVTVYVANDGGAKRTNSIQTTYYNKLSIVDPIYNLFFIKTLLSPDPDSFYFKSGGIFVQQIDLKFTNLRSGAISFDGYLFGIIKE